MPCATMLYLLGYGSIVLLWLVGYRTYNSLLISLHSGHGQNYHKSPRVMRVKRAWKGRIARARFGQNWDAQEYECWHRTFDDDIVAQR